MIINGRCPHCGYYNQTSNIEDTILKCKSCNRIYEINVGIVEAESKMLPKYKLLEYGEDVVKYGFKPVKEVNN